MAMNKMFGLAALLGLSLTVSGGLMAQGADAPKPQPADTPKAADDKPDTAAAEAVGVTYHITIGGIT